ncbi:thiamine phosphate synthase [Mesorhizobium sp. NBSH29]|uniref:thiamine phosphate synthase n=1 Tax=Mesorhizobium sp. NBSH29 TaxID=2654249 RepID=UPI0018966624|nr:thiamine phosphate synthase [Mesorhizobium sp. NBSH29]QPC88304.1 thiamine phosphate synthase [Mesorhizobium sp. NBSH29]
MRLDPFYLIVDSANWLERLVPLGVKLVQLRIKDMEQDALRFEIRRARIICAAYGCQLFINDYWQLAIEEKCTAVHLGQEDLAGADLGAIRNAGLQLGISTHDHAELDAALAAAPDYIALGPIYPTILKQLKWDPQGLDRIGEWKLRIGRKIPLVAIGGLTPERAQGVLEAGADSAAVVTDITLNANPEARTRQWLALAAEHRR